MIYTTSLPVSKRIKELIGEQNKYWTWARTSKTGEYILTNIDKDCLREKADADGIFGVYDRVSAFTLSELPEVLKKIYPNEYKSHHIMRVVETVTRPWFDYYLKCCELHALGQNVDDYLVELLK